MHPIVEIYSLNRSKTIGSLHNGSLLLQPHQGILVSCKFYIVSSEERHVLCVLQMIEFPYFKELKIFYWVYITHYILSVHLLMANWFSFYILLNGHGGRVFLQDHDLTFWKYVPNDDTFGSYANLVFSLRGTPLLFSTGPIVLYMRIGNIPRTGYVVEYCLSWTRPWVWYPAQPTSQPTNKPPNQTNNQQNKQ